MFHFLLFLLIRSHHCHHFLQMYLSRHFPFLRTCARKATVILKKTISKRISPLEAMLLVGTLPVLG
jgi:hypothetical protein